MKIVCNDSSIVDIDIPEHINHIGVMLSGGMDSALLLFLLLTEINTSKRNIQLSVFNVPNNKDDARIHSRNVVSFLEKEFNTLINLIHIGDVSLHHQKMIRVPSRHILDNKLVDRLYVGINQNPPIEFPVQGPTRRNPDSAIPDNLSFPFIHLYKTHILEIYKKFNMLKLAEITHSCTESTNISCNSCFQCYERAWAYNTVV
jgi:hypothetical protein